MKILAVLITLILQAPTGTVTGYKVELGKTTGATDQVVDAVASANKIQINIDTAVYKFLRLRAVNGVSTGQPSAEVNLVFPTAPIVSAAQAD